MKIKQFYNIFKIKIQIAETLNSIEFDFTFRNSSRGFFFSPSLKEPIRVSVTRDFRS